MNDTNVVILGANGQLGLELQNKYPNATALDSNLLDITDQEAVEKFDWSNTTHILNAAAYTNVDGAESPDGRKAAWAVNSSAVAKLSIIANKYDITLVHISSEYVFDGQQELHTENEPLTPISAYGASKAAGDLAAALSMKHYILRTSWVIGDGKNFVRTMLGLADKNISPTVVNDQIGRLTFTKELLRAIDHLLSTDAPYGIYNISNSGPPASWADVTRAIFAELGRNDLTVTNTTTKEYYKGKNAIAQRPLQSTLSLDKIKQTGFTTSDWGQSLVQYIQGETS